jgi:hypothetical protein
MKVGQHTQHIFSVRVGLSLGFFEAFRSHLLDFDDFKLRVIRLSWDL